VTLPRPPLLVITDRKQARGSLEAVTEAVFAAGGRWLSLREKDLDHAARVALLTRLVTIGRRHGAVVTVHEDVAAAVAAGAAGVHLPAGVSPRAAREALGPGALIGGSAHGPAEVSALAAAGADYATLSPIFASASKPGYGPPLGADAIARASAATGLPVIALGGVAQDNAAACIAAGAAGIAMMGGVMAVPQPGVVMAGLIKTLREALAARGEPRS